MNPCFMSIEACVMMWACDHADDRSLFALAWVFQLLENEENQ